VHGLLESIENTLAAAGIRLLDILIGMNGSVFASFPTTHECTAPRLLLVFAQLKTLLLTGNLSTIAMTHDANHAFSQSRQSYRQYFEGVKSVIAKVLVLASQSWESS
jgi:hypothetical protein